MTPDEFKEMLDRYLGGKATRKEEEVILKWYDRIGRKNNRDKLEEGYRAALEEKLWGRLQHTIRKPVPQKAVISRPAWFWAKIAAVGGLFIAVSSLLYLWGSFGPGETSRPAETGHPAVAASMVTVANDEDGPKVVVLNDSSAVTLAPHSEIRYPQAFASGSREVYLTGEAFFQVTRDTRRPFLVYANELVTRVLGTSFTVKAYRGEKEITVAVRSGKVSVYKRSPQKKAPEETILSPNQQAVYNIESKLVSRELVDEPQIILPESTLFVMEFDGTPVADIFAVLEENYGIDIRYDKAALANCFLTTSMTDEGLYERIKIICRAIGASYKVAGTDILIESAGCD